MLFRSKLCTIPTANTWTLIQLPNLPAWPNGNFSIAPGNPGYQIGIVLAAGTTFTAPSADVWNAGNFLAAPGMSNWAASPVNSTFQVAFVQHEPGAVCSTFMDKPFIQNLDECLRYFQKTNAYGVVPGTAGSTAGLRNFCALTAATSAYGPASFHKPMAKIPTVTLYRYDNGAINTVVDGAGANHSGAAAANIGDSGFSGIGYTTATSGAMNVFAQYTADTGW